METAAPTVWLTTLGCAKNQVDSDKVTGMLASAGYAEATSPEVADVVMVNTCGFIERRGASLWTRSWTWRERDGTTQDSWSSDVWPSATNSELSEALPEVDAVIGLDRYPELVDRLDALTTWTPITIGSGPADPTWTSCTSRGDRHRQPRTRT